MTSERSRYQAAGATNGIVSLTGGGAGANSESAEILAGLNTLTGMLHSGVQVPPEHQQALEDIMGPSNPAPQN